MMGKQSVNTNRPSTARRPGYTLAHEWFPNKAAVADRAREIKTRYRVLREVSAPEDHGFLLDLIAWHPEAAKIIGPGIAGFHVLPDETRGGRSYHFAAERRDGTLAHFSYRIAIAGRSKSRLQRIREALRQAVAPQIAAFRLTHLQPYVTTCPLTGELLTTANSNVDNIPPQTFAVLVLNWLEENNLQLSEIAVYEEVPEEGLWALADMEQQASWGEYHRQHARLRLLSVVGNLVHSRQEARQLEEATV